MSNTLNNNALQSGEVEAKNEQILCNYGSYEGKLISLNDSLELWDLARNEKYIIHSIDKCLHREHDEELYTHDSFVTITLGEMRYGEEVLITEARRMYSGKYIDVNETYHVTAYTRRAFHMDERSECRIVLLCEDTHEECEEYEYKDFCTRVYVDGGGYFWQHDNYCGSYIWNDDLNKYLYDENAAQYYGLVYDNNEDEWVTQSVYDDRYSEHDGCDTHHNTRSYHHYTRRSRKDDNNDDFFIGFEVEKEDRQVKIDICSDELYDNLGWCKETDGSLDDISGFEVVSPVYSLFGKQLEVDLKNDSLKKLINATYNVDSCGGHINISSTKYTKEELFEGLSAFYPLLYSIYENRINEHFCKAKKKSQMAYEKDKYSAVFIRDNRVEIRIFPAVKNIDNLLWRRDLIRIMTKNINANELQVFKLLMNKKSKLYRHLLRVMSAETIQKKCIKYLEYSKAFNDKNIDGHGKNLLGL